MSIWSTTISFWFKTTSTPITIVVAKNENAYQYLTDSIQNFYYNPELKNIFNKNGFFCYTEKKYLGGIAILNVFSKV